MASYDTVQTISLVAGADLSTHQFKAVKVDSSGEAVLCDSAGELGLGILCNAPAQGEVAAIAVGGRTKAEFGGTVASGASVATAADGQIIAATTGNVILGIAVDGGADGEIGAIVFNPANISA